MVSIPDGRITATAWHRLTPAWRSELVGMRQIFVRSPSHVLQAFATASLQHCYTIDLSQTLQEISEQGISTGRGGSMS